MRKADDDARAAESAEERASRVVEKAGRGPGRADPGKADPGRADPARAGPGLRVSRGRRVRVAGGGDDADPGAARSLHNKPRTAADLSARGNLRARGKDKGRDPPSRGQGVPSIAAGALHGSAAPGGSAGLGPRTSTGEKASKSLVASNRRGVDRVAGVDNAAGPASSAGDPASGGDAPAVARVGPVHSPPGRTGSQRDSLGKPRPPRDSLTRPRGMWGKTRRTR